MDYAAIHGRDVSSFDLPSTHRLPTVSAAQALQEFQDKKRNSVSTGLATLDALLVSGLDDGGSGGIQKGHVTEIWGPPGVGKTALGIQLAANCLRGGRGVVWVDGFHLVSSERLRAVVGAAGDEGAVDRLDAFTHYACPSLPHLIALLCRPTASCVPQTASLVVVDSLSALVNHAYPKTAEPRGAADAKGKKGPSVSARRLQVLQYVIGGFQKLAATRDLAIVVLSQCATRMQAERGATIIPAINAGVWEQGVSTRLVLFRGWIQDASESRSVHFVGIQKLNGKASAAAVDGACAFNIEPSGLVSVDCDSSERSQVLKATPAPKRKLGDTNFEIADSDDEEYGWEEDEDAVPVMPSQWQGSEDILLGRLPDSDEETHHVDDDLTDTRDNEEPESADKESNDGNPVEPE
ncbi:P-loop containing nucleoside triphosphate hydrolase protein [Lasiosphaeria ovina]|uniref:DNA repair protein RAD51 homolog 3 n=1 Tax=Lasiosphaeria ovina TaxID=92902 RepID=A0AAE0N880_9PEZI|nr:P-loop containing nucleoside triphosphate hydrolase protein [Lasiosphaeria ovina]